jgi:MoCo/4Fe-4S cofactor protein with predicted Tat translocation signal
MKRVFHHPPEPVTGKKYWQSLDQLADTPEFREKLAREFPQGAAELDGDGVSRRHFLKLMGASTALAGVGLTGCRRPEMHLVPFTKSVEWAIPGKPLFYATSMPTRRGSQPLVITTYDGRPTKIEGNPLHPYSKGATDTFAQASILDLYDPDRARFFLERGAKSDRKKFDAYLDQLLTANAGGAGMAFLVEENNSPTRDRLRAEVEKKFPQARWCVYEPLGAEGAQQASNVAYGSGVRIAPQIASADVIVALDCDFLGCEESNLDAVRAFASRRKADGEAKMNRLYVVENRYTITGGMADHRLRCPASQVGAFALALAEKISGTTGDAGLSGYFQMLPKPQVAAKFFEDWVTETANDLLSARGKSLVVVGARQPAAVHLLANAINAALGNLGTTMSGTTRNYLPTVTIGELSGEISDKKVTTLFILGGNPVYNAPADLDWATLQRSIPDVIRLGLHADETSQFARWHIPAAHYLESWGDGLSPDGAYVSQQPMILPLYDGWSELDLLARVAGLPAVSGPELVQETFRARSGGGNFDAAWNKFLHDGFVAGTAPAAQPVTFNATSAAAFVQENANLPAIPPSADALEVVFAGDSRVDDGRLANNGWMQEAPDPITKLTWDNAALISPATAKILGVKSEDVVQISLDESRKIEAPVLIAPGHADHSVTLSLGYGRKMTGRVCNGVGVNVYPLRTTAQPYFAMGAKVKATGRRYPLGITQDHHSMEGRALIREGTLKTFQENPEFARTMGDDAELPAKNPSLYSHPPLDGIHQWGMAIDLNTCTGCNACVIACQSENNTPIVGKEQVISGREMHWIRMDRYFASKDENDPDPEMLTQPMLCQHCENAPCETVCPVNATVHNNEGLNVMAYNRCIGTRYCANNCPFKVRRFNFFNYNERPIDKLYWGPLAEKGTPDTIKMQKNPNVTVRIRGVMEKCTFCVQRIQEAKIGQKVRAGASADVRVPADAFQVACQQACASESIVFGDLSNPASKVAKLKEREKRSYRLLEYLNVNSRISYLARIRNPNMKMPDAEKIAAFEMEGESAEPARKSERHLDQTKEAQPQT